MYLRFALAAALSLAPLGAAEFWQEKKFTEWNEKQVRKLLEDSPWARPVAVSDDGGSGRIRKGALTDAANATGRPGRDRMPSAPPEAAPAITSFVRWHSALPVKQAVARMRFGDAAGTSTEAAQFLARPENTCVLGIANLPSGLIEGTAEELKAAIRLKVKGKPDLAPQEVQRDEQGGRGTLFIAFPRTRDGAPAIDVNDGEVELQVRLPGLKISRKFKLKEMMFNGKLEI